MQKESTQTELRNSSYDQTKFEFKSDLIQILNFSKNMFELDYWIEEIITKKWALVSLDLDRRVKSYGYFQNQGQAILRKKKNQPRSDRSAAVFTTVFGS